ncbi:HNH endonuclease [Fictibacillus phosphorivorans]|uniref:HNH endonuclease n=1 Tax=Fictibacillus phosphorivorans TaxID=1221500 RepID=UPI0035E9CAAF
MSNNLHIVLKFPNVSVYTNDGLTLSDTITEHKTLCETESRLIWGQHSDRFINGVAERNRNRIKLQINNTINTFSFFLVNNKGQRELYVGRMNNIYGLGEMSDKPNLKKYVPSYYRDNLTNQILYVDVNTFFKVDSKYLNNITLESTGDRILSVRNSSSIFLVNISEEFETLLNDLLSNQEENFQYQIEQVDVDEDDTTVEDTPQSKPSKITSGGRAVYKRDAKVSKKAIIAAHYKCELDESHQFFTSKVTGKNYVEAHHLIPMEYQDEFENGIDVEANVVSLCVCCHKKIHHANQDEITPMIESLFRERQFRLKDCEIEITLAELLSFYKVNTASLI